MSLDALWFADTALAKIGRATLSPLSAIFRGVVSVRRQLYDRGVLAVVPSAVPTISIGNISVGGTGKTPVSAYFVRRFLEGGRTPALVMRGYGADEPEVHRLLNPGVRVYTDADRARGIAAAAADGADVVVLDDAFQHRRAARHADVVLVSAERWRYGEFVLPAGSLREPPSALRRATLVIVTHKVASHKTVERVMASIRAIAPHVPVAAMHLRLDALHAIEPDSNPHPPTSVGRSADSGNSASHLRVVDLFGVRVLAIAGVGDPESFFHQLESAGAHVTRVPFPDHHPFTAADGRELMARSSGHKYAVSTLKDAVKLRHMWPPKGPRLWYVSQAVEVSAGSALIDTTVRQLFL